MCMDVRKRCECGASEVQFHLRDNVMVPAVIDRLYCPHCSGNDAFDSDSMLYDNGWVIQYDMDIARGLAAQKLGMPEAGVSPEFIFDYGYCCWQELYPGEKEEMRQEKEEIMKMARTDPKGYLVTIQKWNIERVQRLKEQGWRRVLAA